MAPAPASAVAAPDAKTALRRQMRQRRMALPGWRRCRAELQVLRQVTKLPGLRPLRRVALYHAIGSEFPTRRLIAALRQRGCTVYLPVISGHALRFAPNTGALRRGAHRIAAPQSRIRLPARALQLVLLPLLAFDARGIRLGQGGGHYDRTLSAPARWPRRVGLAFAAQALPALPAELHDVPLHGALTERGYHPFYRP